VRERGCAQLVQLVEKEGAEALKEMRCGVPTSVTQESVRYGIGLLRNQQQVEGGIQRWFGFGDVPGPGRQGNATILGEEEIKLDVAVAAEPKMLYPNLCTDPPGGPNDSAIA
jgi:hypothetical protein